jgi:uncharacterized protein
MHLPEWLEIRSSPIHGTGVFARSLIRSGMRVIEYVGERISKSESLRRCELGNPYIFSVSDDFDIDGEVEWNPARFINHSCSPNCEAQLIRNRIWVVTLEEIPAGGELTFNYGYDLEEYKDYPCRCGAPNCVGYIIAADLAPLIKGRSKIGSD